MHVVQLIARILVRNRSIEDSILAERVGAILIGPVLVVTFENPIARECQPDVNILPESAHAPSHKRGSFKNRGRSGCRTAGGRHAALPRKKIDSQECYCDLLNRIITSP